jgi:four helix bundle protein
LKIEQELNLKKMSNRDNSIILKKAFDFAVKIVKFNNKLTSVKHFILGRQLLRSGTSIGANVNEALAAYSRKDFIHKMMIALKEAQETEYWLKLINASDLLKEFDLLYYLNDVVELQKILTSIINTSKKQLIKENDVSKANLK